MGETVISKSKKKRMKKPKLCRANTSPRKAPKHETKSGVPRKLGPRDIGRIKYKGTKYNELDNSSFLEEKINKNCKSKSFAKRKSENPISKKRKSCRNWSKTQRM